jgi:hypothetical protein
MHCVKGLGNDHAKFSPVGKCTSALPCGGFYNFILIVGRFLDHLFISLFGENLSKIAVAREHT